MKLKSLTIFFPAYNDAQALPKLIEKADKIAQKITNDYEILVVNDGSKDDTHDILELLKKKYTMLRLIHHPKNKGYGGALRTGFKNAKKSWVFYTDGDGQYDPSELLHLLNVFDESIDVVNGYKLQRSDSYIRKMLGSIYANLQKKIFNLPIRDVDCDFRLMKNSILKKTNLTTNSGSICLELVLELQKNGAHFKEVGVHHYARQFGSSQFFTLTNLIKTLNDNLLLFQKYKLS